MNRSFRRCRAFTLIELVIVLAVIGLLAGIAMPRYARAVTRQRAAAAAKRIAADLELAGRHAVHTSTSRAVVFGGNGYTIAGLRDFSRSGRDYSVDLSTEPYEVTIIHSDFGGDTEVVFDCYGRPDSGGEVQVAVGDWSFTVQLDAETGRAKVE